MDPGLSGLPLSAAFRTAAEIFLAQTGRVPDRILISQTTFHSLARASSGCLARQHYYELSQIPIAPAEAAVGTVRMPTWHPQSC